MKILAAPILPIVYCENSSLPQNRYQGGDYQIIASSIKDMPEAVRTDMEINSSLSVSDWLMTAERAIGLNTHVQEVFANLRSNIIDLAKAGLDDTEISQAQIDQISFLKKNLATHLQHLVKNESNNQVIAGVQINKALESLVTYTQALENRLVVEKTNQRNSGIE